LSQLLYNLISDLLF